MIIAVITAVMFALRKFWTWIKNRRDQKNKETLLVAIVGLLNKADLNLLHNIYFTD